MAFTTALILIALAFVAGLIVGRSSRRPSFDNPLAPGANDSLEAAKLRAMGVQAAAPAGAADAFLAEPQTNVAGGTFRVILMDKGPNVINTIKALREVTRLGLADTKHLVDAAPSVVAQVVTRQDAERIVQALQGFATVRIEG